MKNKMKGVMAVIPLVMALTGPASAALSDQDTNSAVDNSGRHGDVAGDLLNRYAGLAPGDPDLINPDIQTITLSRQISAFTGADGPMSMYYTVLGGNSSGTPSYATGQIALGAGRSDSDAAAPAVAAITSAHYAHDSLVGAVAGAMAPTSSSGGSSASPTLQTSGDTTNSGTFTTTIIPVGTGTFTTTITPVTPAPILPAAALFGSGLAALATLRKRNRDALL